MSATANDIINRAARRLGIVSEGEALSAEGLSDGLTQLNDMMMGFGAKGIDYVHVTLVASDTVNVPDQQVRNVALLMAQEMADDYGKTISPQLATAILEAKQALQAWYHVQPPAVSDPLLRRRRPYFDITRMDE